MDNDYKLFGVRAEARESDYPMPQAVPLAPLLGNWGYLGYYVPAGLMPDQDLALYLQQRKGEELYHCIREEPPFAVVQNNAGHEYRVNSERFLWIPTPRFQIGDCVQTKVGTLRVGQVAVRSWHRKEMRLFYLITIETKHGRKLHTRRYWSDEIESCSAPT